MPLVSLDPAYDERHVLDARPHMRESLVWVLALPTERLGAVAYTWVDAHGSAGAAGIAFGPAVGAPVFERVDGVPVADDMRFADWKAGPMSFSICEPLRRSRVDYVGDRVGMSFQFEALHDLYAYGSHPEPFPSWFADERCEQGGRAHGTLRVDDREVTLDGFCHRDHSWGARDWGSATHYKWLNFLADDVSVHVMDLQGLGRSSVRGYVHRDGETAQITDARFDYELDDRAFHTDLAVTLTDEAGRSTVAELTDAAADIAYPIDPRMTLLDVVGAARIDGAEGVAYAEMAWAPEYLDHLRAS